jgi:ankyrin
LGLKKVEIASPAHGNLCKSGTTTSKVTMSVHLPLDVLYAIWAEITSSGDMNAFAQMSCQIYQTFNPKLYRHAVLTDNGASAMIWAALNNQESTMQKLLEQGADPTTNDIDREAQPDESLENVIKQAIEDGTSLELGIEGGNSRTPLAYAAQLGHSGIVKLLIDAGDDVDARGRDGTTPMTWAVSQGHDNVLALLLAKDASIDVVVGCSPNPLAWAITHGYTKIVQLLIAKDKAQVNCPTPIRLGISKMEGSPLSTAARYGYEEIVCLLLSAGAVVAPRDFDYASPLHWAVWNDQERMIGLLVDHGADVEATDAHNKTPLHWAARDGHIRALEVLLDRGAKVDGRGSRRTTALTIAAARDNGIARLLLKRNANIDARDRYDRTPLHIAAQYGVANNVRDLLENGADPTVTTKHGYTPVSLAVQHSNRTAVLALLGGGTPLEWAPSWRVP